MVKINFSESRQLRLFLNGDESNFVGFITRILGISWIEDDERFVFLMSEGVVVRYVMCLSSVFKNIISQMHLHQLIIIERAIARFGVLDAFTNDPLINDFRFEINEGSYIKLIPITLGINDFVLLPNIKIEIVSEDEE